MIAPLRQTKVNPHPESQNLAQNLLRLNHSATADRAVVPHHEKLPLGKYKRPEPRVNATVAVILVHISVDGHLATADTDSVTGQPDYALEVVRAFALVAEYHDIPALRYPTGVLERMHPECLPVFVCGMHALSIHENALVTLLAVRKEVQLANRDQCQ